jgi:hypothetical protein
MKSIALIAAALFFTSTAQAAPRAFDNLNVREERALAAQRNQIEAAMRNIHRDGRVTAREAVQLRQLESELRRMNVTFRRF